MLGRTNTGGGGSGGLNFQVIGGTTAPSNPKENMIWVNTSTKITSYIFSATQPTGSAGMVWISTGTSSTVEFNALKKNGIQVYPLSVKQYTGGAWVEREAKSYQNGNWTEWATGVFIKNGDLIRNLNARARAGSGATVTQRSGYVEVKNPINTSTAVLHDTLIDVTDYSKLTLNADVISVYVDGGGNPKVGPVLLKALNAGSYSEMNSNIVAGSYTSNKGVRILECDISSFSGKYYVGILLDGGDEGYPELQVYDFYLS